MSADTGPAFTDEDLGVLLRAVGADHVGPAALDQSFEQLALDSLARTEIAARVRERWSTDIEADLTADTTPNQVRGLVLDRLAAVEQ
jgi:hypothetical protein